MLGRRKLRGYFNLVALGLSRWAWSFVGNCCHTSRIECSFSRCEAASRPNSHPVARLRGCQRRAVRDILALDQQLVPSCMKFRVLLRVSRSETRSLLKFYRSIVRENETMRLLPPLVFVLPFHCPPSSGSNHLYRSRYGDATAASPTGRELNNGFDNNPHYGCTGNFQEDRRASGANSPRSLRANRRGLPAPHHGGIRVWRTVWC